MTVILQVVGDQRCSDALLRDESTDSSRLCRLWRSSSSHMCFGRQCCRCRQTRHHSWHCSCDHRPQTTQRADTHTKPQLHTDLAAMDDLDWLNTLIATSSEYLPNLTDSLDQLLGPDDKPICGDNAGVGHNYSDSNQLVACYQTPASMPQYLDTTPRQPMVVNGQWPEQPRYSLGGFNPITYYNHVEHNGQNQQQLGTNYSDNALATIGHMATDGNCQQSFVEKREPLESLPLPDLHRSYGQMSVSVNPMATEEQPICPVTELTGQLLTDKQFNEETQLGLSCGEDMDNISSQDSMSSATATLVTPLPMPTPKARTMSHFDGSEQLSNQWSTCMQKTFTRIPRHMPQICIDQNCDTKTAAKGLMMLSIPKTFRESRIVSQTKLPRGEWARLDYQERTKIKRERNRIAAKKCRQKKLEKISKLDQMKTELMAENGKCETYLLHQRKALARLQLLVLKHRASEQCSLN